MACFSPIKGYRSSQKTAKGRFGIQFKPAGAFIDLPVEVPCGKCLGCLMERARSWAVRCVHESSLYRENCFLTLTYGPDHLPENGSLQPRDFVLFMKRLRKKLSPTKIRYFQCGEYGEKLSRPHHHCIIFGWEPEDKLLWKKEGNTALYISPLINELWGKGFVTVGAVNLESAYYIARYVLKKVNGPQAKEYYEGKVPEYITMSRRPGLGKLWIDKYSEDVYNSDNLHYGLGQVTKPPKYYDKQYEKLNPGHYENLVKDRIRKGVASPDNVPHRLKVREKVMEAKMLWKKREYEINGS